MRKKLVVERGDCGSVTGPYGEYKRNVEQPRTLPSVVSLASAVSRVIESNRADGYMPNRFIQATAAGTASNLLAVCTRLINSGEALQHLEKALLSYPTLLTIEDFVGRYGEEWGFDAATIEMAAQRSQHFDKVACRWRYA